RPTTRSVSLLVSAASGLSVSKCWNLICLTPSQSRYDRVLRQGRYRVTETGDPALAEGTLMRQAVDRYIATRTPPACPRERGVSVAQFAPVAAEAGEPHVGAARTS